MKSQFYPEPEDAPTPGGPAGGPSDGPPTPPEEDAGNETALLPKSMLGECQVGDTVTVKIVAEHEGEFEVSKAEESPPEKDDGVPSEFGGRQSFRRRPRMPGGPGGPVGEV